MDIQGTPPSRPSYKKKRYIAILATVGLISLLGLGSADKSAYQVENRQTTTVVSPANYDIPVQKSIAPVKNVPAPSVTTSDLSNNNYYTNTYGNKVHSPAYSEVIPIGASAQCRDGTYSFSQSRRGTCSHHGGVEEWL